MRTLVSAGAMLWLGAVAVTSGQVTAHPSLLRNHPAIAYGTAPVEILRDTKPGRPDYWRDGEG